MFTGHQDTDLIILNQLNDKDLLNFCRVSKYARKLCQNEDLWRNRFVSKYGFYKITRTWKNFYLSILIYLNSNKEMLEGLREIDVGFFNAIQKGDKEAINFFISIGAQNWNLGLEAAASVNDLEMANFFLDKGADELDSALKFAAEGNHLDMIKLLADKGADVNDALFDAVRNDCLNLIKIYLEYGANIEVLENLLELARDTDREEIADYLERYIYGS